MNLYSAHTRPFTAPVLVPERFSWGAAVFGPVWLALHRAWVPACVALFAVLLAMAAPVGWRGALAVALGALLGLFGQDCRRWSLARRGFTLAHVVAASDQDAALARLLGARPDLVSRTLQ